MLKFEYLIIEAAVLALGVSIYYLNNRYKIRRCRIPFGDYILVQEIGIGGMAVIYLAQHRENKDHVAVKLLQTKCSDRDSVRRFIREGENLKTIKEKFPHSPVVQVYDYGRENTTGRYMIIMEYLPGENLKKILESKRFIPFNLKLHIIKEVAKALHASHTLNIFHRDVSPDNIMVYEKKITLIDFGIAKVMIPGQETVPGSFWGKYDYISPEQCNGDRVTAKSDIYSLGVVSFYLLEGKPMYTYRNYYGRNMHLNYPLPPIKAKVPEDLKRFIYRMLHKDPAYRPHAREVVETMRFFIRSEYETMSLY